MSVLRSLNNKTRGGLGRVCTATGMYRSIEHVNFAKFQTWIFGEWKAPYVLWTLNQEFLWVLLETLCCVPGVAKTPYFHCTFMDYSNQVWEWLPCHRLASGPNKKLTYPLSLLMLQCIMEWQGWACMATCFWLECKLITFVLHVHVPTSFTSVITINLLTSSHRWLIYHSLF